MSNSCLEDYSSLVRIASGKHRVYTALTSRGKENMKVVLKEFDIDNGDERRALKEVRALKMLSHRCVVDIRKVFMDKNKLYVEMAELRVTFSEWVSRKLRRWIVNVACGYCGCILCRCVLAHLKRH